MNEWFECKVRYEKTLENGQVKKVTEPYLVDALSFTEAEHRFIEETEPELDLDNSDLVFDVTKLALPTLYALREYMQSVLEQRNQKYPE